MDYKGDKMRYKGTIRELDLDRRSFILSDMQSSYVKGYYHPSEADDFFIYFKEDTKICIASTGERIGGYEVFKIERE